MFREPEVAHGAEVVSYRRTLLVYRRGATAPYAQAGY